MTTTIDDVTFAQALRKVVAERGEDFVYPQPTYPQGSSVKNDDEWWYKGACVYAHPDGTPACIIGAALYEIDPTLVPDYNSLPTPAYEVLEDLGVSYALQIAAADAQTSQDQGRTWGQALHDFETSYDRKMSGGY